MPCTSCEGMGDAYREDPEARRDNQQLQARIDELQRRLDDHADSLCFLRELLAVALFLEPFGARTRVMVQRLMARIQQHREFDAKEGRS